MSITAMLRAVGDRPITERATAIGRSETDAMRLSHENSAERGSDPDRATSAAREVEDDAGPVGRLNEVGGFGLEEFPEDAPAPRRRPVPTRALAMAAVVVAVIGAAGVGVLVRSSQAPAPERAAARQLNTVATQAGPATASNGRAAKAGSDDTARPTPPARPAATTAKPGAAAADQPSAVRPPIQTAALPDPRTPARETASVDRGAAAREALPTGPAGGTAATGRQGVTPGQESAWLKGVWGPQPFRRSVAVGRGDTLMTLLTRAGIPRGDAYAAISALRPVYDPRRLRVGQDVALRFFPKSDGKDRFLGIRLDTGIDRAVTVERGPDGAYSARAVRKPVLIELSQGRGTIRSSLYLSGLKEGVPAAVMIALIRIFSFDVDFQRDIQPGDRFEIMYEQLRDVEKSVSRPGRILYAALTLRGVRTALWLYKPRRGPEDYFNEKGNSVRKALMRTPIDGARLSSGFGMRRHPILGYTRMHRGTDFAAPRGTPIYAAGSGTVEFAGRRGGYGNYIRVRHNATYKTAYAHMRGFARGIRAGVRVKQGQTIGYVGTTGRSTGPHLHYEVLLNGRQINSRTMKLPSGQKLKGAERKRFQAARATYQEEFAALLSGRRITRAYAPEHDSRNQTAASATRR